ncbi:hemerythrin domain-containing protein [Trinickia dinghuensis]|uniref:Hemerythrin domain-containing protein n=2 Tax=Trinickia dinghuensis TaxID=2291023 RepID=A0A3D8K3D0_9BURK|nr:hemerythrin domain-containing protein [Trinickia dinghuensis]RDU99364.1 hemerythrin domain-containing protein [Trinickia dinghuensis]
MRSATQRDATYVIVKEHQQLSAVIAGMQRFVSLLETGADAPPTTIFRAMLYYIREYPERIHHPKEDLHLFARLRERTEELDDVIDELESQHAQGESKVRNLEHALTRYELAGESVLPALRTLVDDYAQFYSQHRHIEENVILPAARRYFTEDDWADVDAAFSVNRDPFDGDKLEEDLEKLFVSVLNIV